MGERLYKYVENADIQNRKVITVSDNKEIKEKGMKTETPPNATKQMTYADIVRLGKPYVQNNAECKNRELMNTAH